MDNFWSWENVENMDDLDLADFLASFEEDAEYEI